MRLLVTGSPGVGKTSVAKLLGRRLKCKVINERDFALKHRLGKFENGEFVVPLGKLKELLNREIGKARKIIVEGHLLCEIRLKADAVAVLRLHPELLEARLEKRGYSAEKIQDNVFCEGIDYCSKHALRNYGKKVFEVFSGGTAAETAGVIINKLRERELV